MDKTTNIKHAAARATILAIADRAAAGWTGVDWDTAPSTVLAALRAGKLIDACEEQIQSGTFWGARDPSSNDAQLLNAAWRRLMARIEDATEVTDDLVEDAAEITEAERGEVAADAEEAAVLGRAAADFAGAGDWDEAIEAARKAAAIECAYGDAPAWGALAAAIKELPEYLGERRRGRPLQGRQPQRRGDRRRGRGHCRGPPRVRVSRGPGSTLARAWPGPPPVARSGAPATSRRGAPRCASGARREHERTEDRQCVRRSWAGRAEGTAPDRARPPRQCARAARSTTETRRAP